MSKRPTRRKYTPQRTCVACRAARPKRDLVRIVRTPEGTVIVDETGKRNGRGAYLCRRQRCWDKALSNRQLNRALQVTLSAETESELRTYACQELPQAPAAESGETEESLS